MEITVIGGGRVGTGLARLWRTAGHAVSVLSSEGGDAAGADVVVVAVPAPAVFEALGRVSGLAGQVTIDTCNVFGGRDEEFPSLSHQLKSIIGGPTAKAFSTNFAADYDRVGEQLVRPSNLFAAEPKAREIAERLSHDAGYDPVFVGDLDPGARLLEDSFGLTRALARQFGHFFYRYARPGAL
jgi:predicted dinucleotide-binding enzyme